MEAQIPGLSSLSSAYASVRADDGICVRDGRIQNSRSWCSFFDRAGDADTPQPGLAARP
jgi:hypothetical protein